VRDRERKRAADALASVLGLVDQTEKFRASYRSYVDRLGGAILTNGLGQALATELAAAGTGADGDCDKAAHRRLADNVSSWLREARIYDGDVMAAIVSGDQERYLRAQTEAMAWLTWHKKFCHANLPTDSAQ
jgi:CRISPR-associated protein Cmr5